MGTEIQSLRTRKEGFKDWKKKKKTVDFYDKQEQD